MSQENIETVRRIYDAFGEGDFARALEEGDPDFEWIPPEQDIHGPVQGLESLRRFLEDQNETFEDFRVEAEELKDNGDQVLALVRVRGRGRASGVDIDIRAANLWTFRGGRLIRGQVFPDREKAFEAAGRREKAMSQENVEIVRAALDAYDRGDREALRRLAAPDCEVDWSRSVGPQHGVYGVDEAFRVLPGAVFESVQTEAEEFIEAGDHVITPVVGRFRGRDGIEVTARFTYLWTFRDGACVRLTLYQERQAALEAAGLTE